MINSLRDKIFSFNSSIGVEIKIASDGNCVYNFIQLEKKKENLIISNQGDNFTQLSLLINSLPKNSPISLNFSGKGILFKKINEIIQREPQKILQSVIPSANLTDFYIQYHYNDNIGFVQIIKSTIVDNIVNEFQKANFNVVDISLGCLSLLNLVPLLNQIENGILQLGEYEFEFIDGSVTNIDSNSKNQAIPIQIGEELVPNSKLVSYCSSLQIFLGSSLYSSFVSIKNAKEEFLHKQLYSKLLVGSLVFVMMILLINFFFYNHYDHLNKQNQDVKNANQLTLAFVTELETKYQEKEKFFNSSGWSTPSQLSLYADRIAATVPNMISLDYLSIHPVNRRKWKEQKTIEFEENLISISGNCKKSIELNNWIEILSKLNFIKQVDIKNYSHDEFENIGKFELEMTIK